MSKKSSKRRRYTAEFKAEAVRLVEQRGERTVAEIAQSLGVAENILHAWCYHPSYSMGIHSS